MDSPLKKQRWGIGICWDYMEDGRCNCGKGNTVQFFGTHPTLKVEATTTTTGGAGSCGSTIVIMPQRIPGWISSLEYLKFVEGDLHNFATLQTTFEERHDVKALGADYSPGMKKWIVAPGKDLQPFTKWHPKIHNRGTNDVVFYNTNLDRKLAIDALIRCGFYAAQINIVGDDEEAETLRSKLGLKFPAVVGKDNSVVPSDYCDNAVLGGKRPLNFHDGDQTSPAAATTTPSQSSKRPCFSNPESMQAFVRMSQEKQMGDRNDEKEGEGTMMEVGRSSPIISSLLTTAKSAMVHCIGDRNISLQQNKFNEAMYNVVEAIATEMGSRDMRATQYPSAAPDVTPARGSIVENAASK
ncbi:hypothetical protein ACHAXM_009630 [Skeletonema potamos]